MKDLEDCLTVEQRFRQIVELFAVAIVRRAATHSSTTENTQPPHIARTPANSRE